MNEGKRMYTVMEEKINNETSVITGAVMNDANGILTVAFNLHVIAEKINDCGNSWINMSIADIISKESEVYYKLVVDGITKYLKEINVMENSNSLIMTALKKVLKTKDFGGSISFNVVNNDDHEIIKFSTITESVDTNQFCVYFNFKTIIDSVLLNCTCKEKLVKEEDFKSAAFYQASWTLIQLTPKIRKALDECNLIVKKNQQKEG